MKHLILQDDNLTYMVYYRPKDKAKMYETIYRSQQSYWKKGTKRQGGLLLINYITQWLNEKGFKVVDITKEIDNKINVFNDLEIDSFNYKYRTIHELSSGFGFFDNWLSFTTCDTIEQAIDIIDRGDK